MCAGQERRDKRMKRLLFAAAAAAIVTTGLAQVGETPTNIAFRIGGAYPLDSDVRDSVKSFIGVGVDVFLSRPLLPGKNTESAVSIDWLGKSSAGTKGNVFPVLLTQRWYTGSNAAVEEANRSYYFGGIGFAVVDLNSTKTVVALKAGLGYELNRNIFAELSAIYAEPANKLRASNIGLHLGYRF